MTVQPHILLMFGTNLGRARTVRVNHADTDVTDLQVLTAMQNILISGTLATVAGGTVDAMRRAVLVEQEIIPIAIHAPIP